jgi:hypothetical protein
MDDKKLKQAAGALKIWIDENRGKHQQALTLLRKDGERNREARDAMYTARVRLAFQVPLYRALRAASQQNQSVIGGEKGAQLYLRRFRSLQEAMEKAVAYPNSCTKRELFGDGFLQFPMLVPDAGLAPLQWQFQTVEKLLNDVHEASVAGQRERLQRAQRAEDARKAFLASLTPVQWTILAAALETAKANGHHAISIHGRDVAQPDWSQYPS